MHIGSIIGKSHARLNILRGIIDPGSQEEKRPLGDAGRRATMPNLSELLPTDRGDESVVTDRITTK